MAGRKAAQLPDAIAARRAYAVYSANACTHFGPLPSWCSLSASERKFHFSESQRDVLKLYYYDRGVQSVSKKNAVVIERIAAEIQATNDQVKV